MVSSETRLQRKSPFERIEDDRFYKKEMDSRERERRQNKRGVVYFKSTQIVEERTEGVTFVRGIPIPGVDGP